MAQYSAPFGWLYCIQHPREPNIKIGMTSTSLEKRLRSANTFSTEPFRILHAKYIAEPYKVEQIFHQIFEPNRVRSDREFFHQDVLPNVIAAFQLLPGVVHPESEFLADGPLRHSLRIYFEHETPARFWQVFNEHFTITNKTYDRVRIGTIRSTLFANGIPDDTDIVVELMREEHFPNKDGTYLGIRSKVVEAIESFAYTAENSLS